MFIILLCSVYLITEAANQIAIHLEFNQKVGEFRTTVNFIDTN